MRRAGFDLLSGIGQLPDDLSFDLPPYVPAKKTPSTPTEFVQHALELAQRHDANNPAGQARFLENTGDMHLSQGRTTTAQLAYATAERLHRLAMRRDPNPLPLALFLGRAADQLKQYGQLELSREYSRKRDAVMFG